LARVDAGLRALARLADPLRRVAAGLRALALPPAVVLRRVPAGLRALARLAEVLRRVPAVLPALELRPVVVLRRVPAGLRALARLADARRRVRAGLRAGVELPPTPAWLRSSSITAWRRSTASRTGFGARLPLVTCRGTSASWRATFLRTPLARIRSYSSLSALFFATRSFLSFWVGGVLPAWRPANT
jgi:hypothetical protein